MTKKRIKTSTLIHVLSVLIVFVLTASNALAVKSFDIIGIPLVFALDLLVQLLLIIVLVFNVVILFKTPLTVAWSILVSSWEGILRNTYVRQFKRQYPRFTSWLGRRFSLKHPNGLLLTVGGAAALIFLMLFLSLAYDVFFHHTIVGIDQRIVNLIPNIRTPEQNTFFSFFTFIASTPSLIVFFIALTAVAWWKRQLWLPVLFMGAFIIDVISSTVLKHLIGRPRPERVLSLLAEDSYSFPSGHTLVATIMFGLAGYLLFRAVKSSIAKLAISLGTIATISLVGLSRIYLGVHFPSDVLASFIFGAFILTVFITAIEINERFHIVKKVTLLRSTLKLPILTSLATVLIFGGLLGSRLTHLQVMQPNITPTPLTENTLQKLPIYSETLTGEKMEPISFIYTGSQKQLEHAFLQTGWYEADPPTASNALKAFLVAFRGGQYLNAPVTPAYLDSRPEALAFEKPTDANKLQQRHHTRIWKTNFTLDGQPIWVATASFDKSFGVGKNIKLPTHRIDPNVDAERAYIIDSLGLSDVRYTQIVQPSVGENASGDAFFTDGRAAIIQLGGRP